MSKETLGINTNNSNSENPVSGEARKRQRLVASVQKLGELREYTESSVNAIGSLEAEQTLLVNIPTLPSIIGGNLKGVGNGNQIGVRITSLPAEIVNQTQDQIDAVLCTSLFVNNLASARRLEPYLPAILPRTQAGFKTLKFIAKEFVKAIPTPDVNGSSNIPNAVKVLDMLDKELKIAGLGNEGIMDALSVPASEQAQAILGSGIDSSGKIAQIRAMITQQRIYALRRAPTEVPGSYRFAKYQVLVDQVIERDNLFGQMDSSANEAARERLKQAEEAMLAAIARKRAIGTVMSLIDQDPLLCKVLADRSRLTSEGLITAESSVKKRVAYNALDSSKRIILSAQDRRTFNGQAIVDGEKAKLRQAFQQDPQAFEDTLSDEELIVYRHGIPKISDEKAVYNLAKDKLKKQLEDEVTDDEIAPELTRAIIDEKLLPAIIPDAIDAAIAALDIDRNSVFEDPNRLALLKDEIVTNALKLMIVGLSEGASSEKAATLTASERKDQKEAFISLFRAQKLTGRTSALEARSLLDQQVEVPETAKLGPVVQREDIKSSLSPFQFFPEYKTTYPRVVVQALENLYAEYNQAFRRLVAANREWDTDYQYLMESDGTPINSWVQIDMVGLPSGFLATDASLPEEEVRESLRGRIFEIENSLAMYQLLGTIFSNGSKDTLFKRQLRTSLDRLRQKYGKPVALLAVTEQKYKAMKEIEFGKMGTEQLTDGDVKELSGFDRFFGPEEFQKYVSENAGQCDYLLFVRSSDPVEKMKRPEIVVKDQLLADDGLRRIIKANSITFNIDNPNWPIGDSRRINDTKEYLEEMGMAYAAFYSEDLQSTNFETYLRSQGIDPEKVKSGEIALRAKPMKGTYGGYGHLSGTLSDAKFRRELRHNLRIRGPYVVQPEMQNPTITNQDNGETYRYIDRVYFSTDGQNYEFMGGGRTLIPASSREAQQNRIHGNISTVYAEID